MAVNVNGGALEFDAVINAGQFNAAISAIERQLTSLTKKSEDQVKSVDSLVKKTSLAISSYVSFATAKNFIGDIVRVRGEFQQLEVAFRTMLKNKAAADKLLAEATELAAKTPFTLQEVGTSAKQLLAYGFGVGDVTKNIEMLGNVASGVGAPLGDIVYLYGTLRTQGRAFQKDITQFTQRGIDIFGALQKTLGKSKEELASMIEAGKIGFPEVEKAFQSLTNEGGLFFNLMQEQSKTLTGLVSNLQDAWSRMLNDIGKSNEGLFADAIKGAISLVDNYQDVLDILKVLVITYGTYRAAIIVTNAVTAISTSLTRGWTIAELLRYKAMVLSERAMKILNATMLSNPAVAVATGIALIASALLVMRSRSDGAAEAQKRLNAIKIESLKTIDAEKVKLETLLKVARDETKSKEAREAAIRKINQISPEYLGNLTLENIKTGEATTAINAYIKAIERKAQAQAAESALSEISRQQFDAQLDMINRIDQRRKQLGYGTIKKDGKLIKAEVFDSDGVIKEIREGFAEESRLLEEQKEKIKQVYGDALTQQITGEGDKQKAKQRTVDIIEEEIKALKDQQSAISSTSKQYQDFQKKINALEAEKNRITGDKKAAKEQQQSYDQRLNDLKQLLSDINNAEADARQSGLLKEQSQIDQINERYDQLKQRAKELKASEGVLQRIENARVKQVGNVNEKEAFELYKRSLQDQKTLFDQFEQYKLTVGEEKSRELLGIQQDDFTDYLAYLEAELIKVGRSGQASTLGGRLKIQFLTDAIVQAEKGKKKQLIDEQAKAYADMLAATFSFRDKEKEINDRYDKLENTLTNDATVKNKQERFAILKQSREDELKQLQLDAFRQSAIFKKLNEDITLYSRERIKELIKDLQNLLKNTAGLSPVVKKQIEDQIKGLQDFLKETSIGAKAGNELEKIAQQANELSGSFRGLANELKGVNQGLGDTVEGLSDAIDNAVTALSAGAKFAAGDFVGAATDTIKFITNIIEGFAKAKSTRIAAQQEVEAFYLRLRNSELEINQIYRDRQREQVKLNKLRIEGLLAEKKLLEEQKKASEKAFKDLMSQIQNEQFVSGQGTQSRRNPFSLIGGPASIIAWLSSNRTTTTNTLSSLAGKSYEDLEKLFLSGQLTDKAKELFLQLQKLKQEGVDIDAALEENKLQIQELFTGTTSGSITDAIVDGFKNGKRSASDFADTFEQLMRDAVFNSLKFQALEGPLKEFYQQFAELAESDGILTSAEIEQLRANFASIIGNAQTQFDQLQQVTNLNLGTGSGSSANNLTGAVKGITEQQAQLLAGQFGGLRLTAIDQLNVARANLDAVQKIQVNTGLTAERISIVLERMDYYFNTYGVKIR